MWLVYSSSLVASSAESSLSSPETAIPLAILAGILSGVALINLHRVKDVDTRAVVATFFWSCNRLQFGCLAVDTRCDTNAPGGLCCLGSFDWRWSCSNRWTTVLDEGIFNGFPCPSQCRGAFSSGGGRFGKVVLGATHPNHWQYAWNDLGHRIDRLGDSIATVKRRGDRGGSKVVDEATSPKPTLRMLHKGLVASSTAKLNRIELESKQSLSPIPQAESHPSKRYRFR